MKNKRIAIVGGGIMGRLLSLHCAEKKYHVSLFDKNDEEGRGTCSYAAAGMLAPYAELEKAEEEVFTLGISSFALWPKILQKWGKNVFYQKKGTIVIAHSQEQKELEHLASKMKKYQAIAHSFIQPLSGSDIQNIEPHLPKKFQKGLFLSEEAHLDVRSLLRTLKDELSSFENVNLHFHTLVSEIKSGKILLESEWIDFDLVFDCRGLGAQDDLKDLRGVRGEIMRIKSEEVSLSRPVRLLHPRYPLYIVPLENHEYILGATLIESESTKNISVQSVLELLSAAYSIHTGFAEAEVLEFTAQLRPGFSDNVPKIIQEDEKLIRINGLYRHGFLSSPALCERAMALL